MDRQVALLAAALLTGMGLAGCGGGGGDPGICSGSLEVCSEGREPGEVVITTTGSGTAGGVGVANPTDSAPETATPTTSTPPTFPLGAGGN